MSVVRNDLGVQVAGLGRFEHTVQFYDNEAFLYPLVADFLADGLRAGEPVIVIATGPHREAFAAHLSERGIDLQNPRTASRVTFLDAHETLATFMSGGMPDEPRFQKSIGGTIEMHVNCLLYTSPSPRDS